MSIESQSKPIVLVIDPDPLTMTGMAAALHLSGYEVHCARDGEAARKATAARAFDLIISEVKVEGESGLEICQLIQSQSLNHDASVMFVTSHQSPDIIRRSHAAGGVYYLRKPFDPHVLLELVDKALWVPHLVRNRLAAAATTAADQLTATVHGTDAGEHVLSPEEMFVGESFTTPLPAPGESQSASAERAESTTEASAEAAAGTSKADSEAAQAAVSSTPHALRRPRGRRTVPVRRARQ